MIIPRFSANQDHDNVYVIITVPYIRITNVECITIENEFSFYCKPYLLKLIFMYSFQENSEQCKVTYDLRNNGTLVATLPKLIPGQYFPDLDLSTKLLQTTRRSIISSNIQSNYNPSIEVLQSNEFVGGLCSEAVDVDGESLNMATQSTILPQSSILLKSASYYGFNHSYSGIFHNLREELQDMLEIKDPEEMNSRYRRQTRISCENILFDIERYLGDLLEGESDSIYKDAINFEPFYIKQWNEKNNLKAVSKNNKSSESDVHYPDKAFELIGGFTESEKQIMSLHLINKEYLIVPNSNEEKAVYLGLADILFAYCYDIRITNGESNVESAHNIARLSCCLSWLEDFIPLSDHNNNNSSSSSSKDVTDYICFTLRRSIIYPYLRLWKFARKVLADVAKILLLGKRAILKCLLHIKDIFEHTDTHYLLNKIYIDDYCIWIQDKHNHHQETLYDFAKQYNNCKSKIENYPHQGKELMGFNLPEVEGWLHSSSEHLDENDGDYCNLDEIIPENLLRYTESQHNHTELAYLLPISEIEQELQNSHIPIAQMPLVSRLVPNDKEIFDIPLSMSSSTLGNKRLIIECGDNNSQIPDCMDSSTEQIDPIINLDNKVDLLKPISTRRLDKTSVSELHETHE